MTERRELNEQDFIYIKYRFGFTKTQILDWIKDLRTNHFVWYKRLLKECVLPSYNRYFEQIEKLKNDGIQQGIEVVSRCLHMVDGALEEGFHSIKYNTVAFQMVIEQKNGKRFFELENLRVVLSDNEKLTIFVFNSL